MEQEVDVVNNWAASAMINTYQAEIVHLTEVQQGLHFGANWATLEQLEGFALEDLGTRMKIIAPFMWQMLAALLDSDHCQQDKQTDTIEYEADSLSESTDLFSDDDSIWGDIDLDEPSRENLTHRDTTHDEHEAGSLNQKQVMILLVFSHSSNQKFNAFQAVIGFFLKSKQCPKIILEMVAHMGISVSVQSVSQMVNSLSKKAEERIKTLGPSNNIYDNFDMEFLVAHPTPDHQKYHLSATAVTFTLYLDIDHERDLRFTQELRETSEYNINISPDDAWIYKPRFDDIFPTSPLTTVGPGEDQG
ncbi:hypothetical protein ARMGADRAFT_928311 [Armillaria gallica]|uniref:Uncharacterized protein n=1 Tax=Armillaria gallica TaxID=47427 RepID=A0A2H3E269_ARMGA|nr:hypothetical protein ARMGADRAFT_928311 [Armillaria gallica]